MIAIQGWYMAHFNAAMVTHRNNVSTFLQLHTPVIEQLSKDPALRIMVFCAADTTLGSYTLHDIAFPHQVELKVNEGDTKANLRGLKNKPGSTRPADITDYIRQKEKYSNKISLIYALTSKVCKYSTCVFEDPY
jgi:E3 SUMO-protein ligase PIAS1